MFISTHKNLLAVLLSLSIAFSGNGHKVIGLSKPALIPCALAALTALLDTREEAPKATTTISASSVRYSSHLCSLALISSYLS